jgi:hypothetical protein
MASQQDFKELLELFNAHRVEYMIVGGYALAFHGVPRFTGDMELLVKPSSDNAVRVLAALADFGFGALDLTPADFATPDHVLQLGVPPVRIDLLSSISGISWDEARSGAVRGTYGGAPVDFIGRAQFVANKRAVGRRRDLADLEALGEDLP